MISPHGNDYEIPTAEPRLHFIEYAGRRFAVMAHSSDGAWLWVLSLFQFSQAIIQNPRTAVRVEGIL